MQSASWKAYFQMQALLYFAQGDPGQDLSNTFNLLTLVKAKLIKPQATLLFRQQAVCTAGKKLPLIQR